MNKPGVHFPGLDAALFLPVKPNEVAVAAGRIALVSLPRALEVPELGAGGGVEPVVAFLILRCEIVPLVGVGLILTGPSAPEPIAPGITIGPDKGGGAPAVYGIAGTGTVFVAISSEECVTALPIELPRARGVTRGPKDVRSGEDADGLDTVN